MFSARKDEKATATRVEEAQAVSSKLAGINPHFCDAQAAAAQVWVANYLAEAQNLHNLIDWPSAEVKRSSHLPRVTALRKAREHDMRTGLPSGFTLPAPSANPA